MLILRSLRVAVGFLTRVPVGDVSSGGKHPVLIASAVPWFPLVGAAIGAVQGTIWWGLFQVGAPLVAAAVAVACALLITGAFHHDGLADMADAFGGGWTVEQRFEILKDSRLGTYGTAALTCAVLLEAVVLSELDASGGIDGFRALVVAHAVGRAAALAAMVFAPVAGDGLGASWMRDLSRPGAALGIGSAAVVAIAVSPVFALWPILAALIAAALVVALSVRKIGGVTGDVLGAITVCASLAALLATHVS